MTSGQSGMTDNDGDSDFSDDDNLREELPAIVAASVLVPLCFCIIVVAVVVFMWKKRKNSQTTSTDLKPIASPKEPDAEAGGDDSVSEPASPREVPETYADIPAESDAGNSYYSLMPSAPVMTSNSGREQVAKKKSSRRRKSDAEKNGGGDNESRNYESTAVVVGGSSAAAVSAAADSRRSTKSSTSSRRGRKSNKYVIDKSELQRFEMVGKGAFGEVYRGEWRHVAVAVKDMKNIEALSDLLREAEELKSLQPHRNVIEFYGVVTDGDSFSIVTAFCANGALSNLLYGKGKIKLEPAQLQSIALGSAAGVRHLHAENVIHRDLAARNILIDDMMTPKIADFGMSRAAGDDGEDNTTMTAVGPVRWMAPEQMTHRKYSRASDVFAFGVVLFEIFTASPPWPGLAPLEVAAKIMGGETLTMPSSVDARVAKVATSCWVREPKERPSMSDVHSALASAFRTVDISDSE
jgi:hypothetical protein